MNYLSDEQMDMIGELLDLGLSIRQIAKIVKCHHGTVSNYKRQVRKALDEDMANPNTKWDDAYIPKWYKETSTGGKWRTTLFDVKRGKKAKSKLRTESVSRSIRFNKEDFTRFSNKAKLEGKTLSKWINDLIKQNLNQTSDLLVD